MAVSICPCEAFLHDTHFRPEASGGQENAQKVHTQSLILNPSQYG